MTVQPTSPVPASGMAAGRMVGVGEELPLSFEQERSVQPHKLRLWWYTFHTDLGADVDIEALDRALCWIVGRHQPLRLRLVGEPGSYRQSFLDPPRSVLQVDTVRGDGLSAHWEGLDVLGSGPLRATLVNSTRHPNRLLLSVHHLAWDAWSYYLLLDEVHAAYEAFSQGAHPDLPPLRSSYRDHVLHQVASGPSLETEQRAFWSEMFAGPAPSIASGAPAARAPEDRWGRRESTTVPTARGRIVGLAGACRVTTPTVLLALIALGLWQVFDTRDVLVALVYHGRSRRADQDLIGSFNRNIPVRITAERGETLGAFLSRLSRRVHAATRLSEPPFSVDRMVDELGLARTASGRLTHVTVSLQLTRRPKGQRPTDGSGGAAGGVGRLAMRAWSPRPSQLWVNAATEPAYRCASEYDRRLFDDEIVEAFMSALDQFASLTVDSLGTSVDALLGAMRPG